MAWPSVQNVDRVGCSLNGGAFLSSEANNLCGCSLLIFTFAFLYLFPYILKFLAYTLLLNYFGTSGPSIQNL